MEDDDHAPYEADSNALALQGPSLVHLPRSNAPNLTSPQFGAGQNYDLQDQQDDLLERLAGHYTTFEGYDLLVKAFEKTVKGNLCASFKDGIRRADIVEDAVRPKIGITFLVGADTPQVTQMEQIQMSQKEPDQKDASWRLNTAGAILKNFDVDKSMSIIFTDITPAVVAAAHQRMSASGPFVDPKPSSQRAVAVRRNEDGIVTIDSDNVKIVNLLSSEKWDLECLLVEVDQSSLMAVILNYRQIINRGGSNLSCGETIKLLDIMIEDARRLCIRSPILFRMSTRRHIISSKNTRYGVDHGTMFQTLTTSSGIKNIISLSVAYFNSLASYNQEEQQMIRPRFLQMLVLLLSLLNDDDLEELAEFLEVTYAIRAERHHIELLILKVLPLMSINSMIFLHSLVTAFDGPLVNPSSHLSDQPRIWSIFLQRLLKHKYILPGTIEQVGGDENSWIVKWPQGGYSNSSIFKNLQYAGSSRTINEIPSINLNAEYNSNEVTAIFTNGCRYIVSIEDLENLTRMSPRRYAVIEATEEGRSFDLDITDVHVNEPLYRAIWKVNSVLTVVKGILPARPRHNMSTRLNNALSDRLALSRRTSRGARTDEPFLLSEIKGSGRLTYHVATLNGEMLAVSYKVEGRKITRRELIRHLASDLGVMRAAIEDIATTVRQAFGDRRVDERTRQSIQWVRTVLAEVEGLYRQAEENKEKMEKYSTKLSDEPITKVLYPIGSDDTPSTVWNDYKAWYVSGEEVLYIEARRRVVSTVEWLNDAAAIEVTFHGHDMKYIVTPLGKLAEGEHDEELKPEDRVILMGQYLAVVELNGMAPTFTPHGTPTGEEMEARSVSGVAFRNSGVNINVSSTTVGSGSGSGNSGVGGVSVSVNAARQQMPLEMVLNWLKITSVETPQRKRRHAQKDMSQMIRSAIR